MIEKTTIARIGALFFEHPSQQFHLREISRLSKLSLPSVIIATDTLAREKIITKTKGKIFTTVAANRESSSFIWHKRLYNLERIYLSEIIVYLSDAYHHPQAIILFGSFSRGEDIERSDIDIAIIGRNETALHLGKFEKLLKKHISVHPIALEKISDEFKTNLANGIVLEGSW